VPLAILLPAVLLQLLAAEWPEFGLFAPALAASLVAAALYALWLYETDAQGQPVTDEVGRQGKAKMAVTAEWAMMVAGILILGWMGGHFFLLRQLPQHAASWTILVMVSTWVADSAAYVFGTRFGRRQLARRLSPKKTVEGYLAGVVVGTAVTVGLAFFMGRAWPVALLLGLLISVASPGGDLAISLLKREAGVKDSGKMLPGHGGALDRIDSLLWSVTLSYYVIVLLT
jgi:phosphatidate cytidylyltransferase